MCHSEFLQIYSNLVFWEEIISHKVDSDFAGRDIDTVRTHQCKLQPEYAAYLADIKDVDAFIFDVFSNPKAEEIYDRFDAFVDIVRKAHPDVPMIFLQTERRETRNFSLAREKFESEKQSAAAKVIRERMKSDKDIYFITSEDFLGYEHIATVDGSHPSDLGFTYMLESISPKIRKIFRKYGIR